MLRPWRVRARSRGLGWVACQAVATFGSGHPRALYHLEDYAHYLYLAGDSKDSLAWYQWLLAVRRRVQGESHGATAGALLGIARATQDCEVAIDAAIAAYEMRLDVLGLDDTLTISTRIVLKKMEDVCQAYLQDIQSNTLSRWKMNQVRNQASSVEGDHWILRKDWDIRQAANVRLARAFLAAGHLNDGVAILLRVLRLRFVDCSFSDQIFARQLAVDVVIRYSGLLTSETVRDLSNLATALERLWRDCNPHEYSLTKKPWEFNSRACLRVSFSFSLALLSQASGKAEEAEYWLAELQHISPEWFATGLCGDYVVDKGRPRLPHIHLSDIVSDAFNSNHQHLWVQDWEMVATESFVHLILSPMVYSEPALATRLALTDWNFAICSASLAVSLRYLDTLYDGKTVAGNRCRLELKQLVAGSKHFVKQDKSESCFWDIRKFSMCRAG